MMLHILSQSVSRSRAQSRARMSSSSSSSSDEEKGPRRSRSPVVNGHRQREYRI